MKAIVHEHDQSDILENGQKHTSEQNQTYTGEGDQKHGQEHRTEPVKSYSSEYTHSDAHTHGDAHPHTHNHTQTKAVLNRMSRIIGHMESVKRMVESGRDCSEVLIQLAAVNSAIQGVSRVILKDHIETCIVDAVKTNDREQLEKLNEAIDRFIK